MNGSDSKHFKLLSIDKFMQSFYNLIVKSQLNCPKESYLLTLLCFWVGFFQISSMMDSFQSNGNSLSSSAITWDEGWKVLIYFTRPIQFIYQEYNQHNQGINITIIIILFLYLIIHAIIAIICSYLIESNNKTKQKVGFQILNIFVNFSIYFNSLLCIIVTETTLLLAFQGSLINPDNIKTQSQTDAEKQLSSTSTSSANTITSYEKNINKICGYTLFVLYQFYSFMNSKFYEISYNLEEKGMQRYCQDNLSLFLNHIRIGAVIGYTIDPKGDSNGPIITTCFASFYFLLSLYEYFAKKPFSNINKSDNYLAALITNMLFFIFMILNKVATVINSSISITMILLVLPILVKLLIETVHKMNDTYLYSNLLDENEISSYNNEKLSRKISMLYNNRELILKQDQLKLFGIYESHKLTCKRQICFCQHNIIKCYEGTVFLLNSDILNRYIRYLIRTELYHSNLNEKIDRLVHFIRYMTNLSFQKKHSFAISRVIDFINESDRMRKSYGTYVKVCVDTVLNVLKQIMFNNIVSTIVEDQVEQQLVDIDSYIRMHIEKAVLKDIVFKCIEKRIEIFEKMRKNFEDFSELEKLNMEYNQCLDELENRFHVFYERFPTKQNQSFYIFFQAEVKGNLKKAIQISNTRKFQQTSENKKLFNVFEPNVLYLTATMGKIWGKIVNFSDKLPNALGYKKQEFNYITHIKDIMPTSIAAIHDEIIRCMMTQGNDSIINNKRQIFLKNKSNFLIRVNVFISQNLYYAEELPFGVFVTPIETRSGFLFVTSQGYIEGMDNNILNQVGYNNISCLPPFYQFKVQQCLPEFEHYAQIMAEQNLSYYDRVDVPLNFFAKTHPQFIKIFTTKSQSVNSLINWQIFTKQNLKINSKIQELIRLQSQSSVKNYSEQESSIRQSMKKMGSTTNQVQNLLKFKADITIERHRIKMLESIYVYYIVEVKYLVRVVNNEEYYTMSSNKTVNNQQTSITNPMKSQFLTQGKKASQKNTLQDLESEKLLNSKRQNIDSAQQDMKQITEENQDVTERQQQKQFLGIDFTNPDLKTSPANSTLANNTLNTQRDNNHFEVLPSAIREEINLDMVHVTARQATNLNLQKQITLGNNLNQSIAYNQQISQINDISQQLDVSMVNNALLEYVQEPQYNLNQSISQDISQLHSANRLYNKEMTTRVTAEIKESDIAKEFMRKSQEKDIEVNLVQAQQNKKEEQRIEVKKRSFTIPDLLERKDLIVKLVKDEREGSLASSTDALNRSLDKYNYYEEFIQSQHHPIHLKIIKVGRLTEYLILLIATIASILTLYTSFGNLLQNIDSLTLHSNILQPYGNTICVSNSLYYLQRYGTSAQKNQLISIQFNREKNQFTQFSEMIKEEWINSYLTNYFTENNLDLYNSYQLTSQNNVDNSNLLGATSRLLFALNENYQYTIDLVLNQFYEPERSFLAVNYSQFLQFFKDLVKDTLSSSISYNSDLITNIIVQTVVLNIITLFIFCLSGWNYYHFSKNIMSILKMCETASIISVEQEMYRFQKMQEELSENENILFNYTFNIQQKEIELTRIVDKSIQYEKRSINSGGGPSALGGTKRKKLLVNVQNEKIKYSGFALFIIFVYLLFVIFTITTFSINTNFLNQFEPAIKYYKSVSDSNFELSQLPTLKALIMEYDLLTSESTKEKSIQYLNTDLSELKSLFDQGLQNILSYRQEILNFNKLDFFDSSFKSQMDSIISGNICDTADDQLDNSWSATRCQGILQGVLTQGLSNSISKWYDIFQSFKQLSYKDSQSIDKQLQTQLDQTYLSITLSNYTTSMRNTIKNSLSSSTQNQKDVNLIISLVFISIVSIIYSYEMFKGMKAITYRFQMAKKIIFLVPLQTVMIEETFIKILKAQSNRLEIVK